MEEQTKTGLTSIELAALTVRVPCSGNKLVDAMIRNALQYQTANDVMAALLQARPDMGEEEAAQKAVSFAKALFKTIAST